jgi:ectoine hydroxylase-related dioxygenase (phytanoyl-CoA dioxygenase family)
MSDTIPIIFSDTPRFDIATEEGADSMLTFLEENGYAVVAGAADAAEIAQAKADFWDHCEKVNPKLSRHDADTWGKPNWFGEGADRNGIISSQNIHHSDFAWNARLLPSVKQAFSNIWRSSDLITSFDAVNAFRPWKRNKEWLTEGGWWHIDQNAALDGHAGKVCVQGLVTYYDCTADSGGLCVIPKSHLHHDALCQQSDCAKALKMDFITMRTAELRSLLGEEVAAHMVAARAGDLILWDSRTVHCNAPALTASDYIAKTTSPRRRLSQDKLKSASGDSDDYVLINTDGSEEIAPAGQEHNELVRLVAYVCMLPRAQAGVLVMADRKQAFVNRIGTSHWPNKRISVYDDPEVQRDPLQCADEVLRLVGYTYLDKLMLRAKKVVFR